MKTAPSKSISCKSVNSITSIHMPKKFTDFYAYIYLQIRSLVKSPIINLYLLLLPAACQVTDVQNIEGFIQPGCMYEATEALAYYYPSLNTHTGYSFVVAESHRSFEATLRTQNENGRTFLLLSIHSCHKLDFYQTTTTSCPTISTSWMIQPISTQ